MTKFFSRAMLIAAALATVSLAQMGGGMMGPGNQQNQNNSMGQHSGMGAGMGMTGAMGSREMMDGPAIGPDGTLYIVRLSASTSSTNRGMGATVTPLKYELVAINPSTGATKWKLEITARMVSEPAFAKDNTIYVTASDSMMNPGTGAAAGKSRLLIITPGGTARTISLDSDVLSTPKVVETGTLAGVYVTGFEMGKDSDAIASGTKTLYGFNLDGTPKFSINTNQP